MSTITVPYITKNKEFQDLVQAWAHERGIYTHSTMQAQLLKGLSEIGELADAVIKRDRVALIDSIGDVAVCIVNAHYLYYKEFPNLSPLITPTKEQLYRSWHKEDASNTTYTALLAALLSVCTLAIEEASIGNPFINGMYGLELLAEANDTTLTACQTVAWEEIKDRKGRMVDGGAFVKEGE